MSTLLMDEGIFTSKYISNHPRSPILKSRENISKLKCSKSLKKKLKKYKLRKDGQEDPDIIDVSKTLISTLKIKSPTNHLNCHKNCDENRPQNYLTRMVRLKETVTVMNSTTVNAHKCNSDIVNSVSQTSKADQDIKQTNAFKLLMESRNKSIGNNSPGKEKCEEDIEIQERAQNKELKAKRILTLNRMAQAKGSLKKIEIEQYREENIKRRMEDRAKKFKSMIEGGINGKSGQSITSKDKLVEKSVSANLVQSPSVVIESKSTLDINLFKGSKANLSSTAKKISKEDEEFLKKLSPSIRKKENMLCYFQKVEKDSDMILDNDDDTSLQKNPLVIKVKSKSRNKASKKNITQHTDKATNSLDRREHEQTLTTDIGCYVPDPQDNAKKRKRYKNNDSKYKVSTNNDNYDTVQAHNDNRPKRNTKKPVKYTDDFQLISSDDELHIFTPKKKRKGKEKFECENTSNKVVDEPQDHVTIRKCDLNETEMNNELKKIEDMTKTPLKNQGNRKITHVSKKTTKLAPIFVQKPIVDSAAIEAKQKFLQSGVPSQLKKITSPGSTMASDEFQKVVHIQCQTNIDTLMISDISNMINRDYEENFTLKEEKNLFKQLLQFPILNKHTMPKLQNNVGQVLHGFKQNYPKFPVYRTYHLLRGKSKGEFKDCIYPNLDNSVEIFNNVSDINNVQPDKLCWADKYKPITEKQVIGNFESIRELRRWLVTWTENDAKSKKNTCGSDSSDFYQSETESRETMKNENNLLIINGKVGTGKTLSVYAVAAELAIKVIEVNASTKRTGKIMLQDLQEATQSHKVDRGKNSTEVTQKHEIVATTGLLKDAKKRGRKKKAKVDSLTEQKNTRKESTEITISQDNARTGMSLILIDDADIVFDQDDGFCYAISQLIQSSKRPVILVTSSLSCSHLLKFYGYAKIIKMRPFLPKMLGTWLDIMCLVDTTMCCPGMGAKVLEVFKGDIRKTINHLQFYMISHKYLSNVDNPGLLESEEISRVNMDDENSCMSWGDNEGWGEKNTGSLNPNDTCKYNIERESDLLTFMTPLDNFNFWWNLPHLLNYSQKYCDKKLETVSEVEKNKEIRELDAISSVLDYLSVTDSLGFTNVEPNITSIPWQSFEKDNVIDNENFANYNKNIDCLHAVSWELMTKGIAEAQRVIDTQTRNKAEINYPSMSIQRDRDRVVSRHKTLTKCLNPSAALDRRALALDYWSSCRSICRTEKNKTSTQSKRNNRFCHYLKSLNIVCRNEYFDNLGKSLCSIE